MGGERIALSGVETERCNLYFTSMFRPAGQLSLMQASGLTPAPRKKPGAVSRPGCSKHMCR
jgi:hypothetical protein